jgi:GNAT superfamily N-acetyltransferase
MMPAELPDITVREVRAVDAELLTALQSEMDDDGADVVDAARMREVLSEMTRYPEFRAYLACDRDGAPVGTFSLMVFCSPSHQGTWQALLDAVVVRRSRRGRGVGEAMLRQALKLAADAGCYKLTLSSNLKRMDAHRFYERLGFSRHGISFSIPLAANAQADGAAEKS